MKLNCHRFSTFLYTLIALQIGFLTSCNTKVEKISFLGFYLDMEWPRAKSMMDSLLNIKKLQYFETTDMLGNKQKNLYYDFSEISPFLCAKVNIRGTYMIDERLTSIQLNLCNRTKNGRQRFSDNCDRDELKKLFELYSKKYGKPTLLDQGERYDWLSKELSNVYLPGPKGRLLMDKIYFWEKGNYIIYFDFGYPERLTKSDDQLTESNAPESLDWTSVPIIYFDFTRDYWAKLLDKESMMKENEFKRGK
jgi:hypothetical protein